MDRDLMPLKLTSKKTALGRTAYGQIVLTSHSAQLTDTNLREEHQKKDQVKI